MLLCVLRVSFSALRSLLKVTFRDICVLNLISQNIPALCRSLLVAQELGLQFLLGQPMVLFTLVRDGLFWACLEGPLGREFEIHGHFLAGISLSLQSSTSKLTNRQSVRTRACVKLVGRSLIRSVWFSYFCREICIKLALIINIACDRHGLSTLIASSFDLKHLRRSILMLILLGLNISLTTLVQLLLI